MNIVPMPAALEFRRLQRLKEAVLGSEIQRPSSIVASDDRVAEINARLADLERAFPPLWISNPSD